MAQQDEIKLTAGSKEIIIFQKGLTSTAQQWFDALQYETKVGAKPSAFYFLESESNKS